MLYRAYRCGSSRNWRRNSVRFHDLLHGLDVPDTPVIDPVAEQALLAGEDPELEVIRVGLPVRLHLPDFLFVEFRYIGSVPDGISGQDNPDKEGVLVIPGTEVEGEPGVMVPEDPVAFRFQDAYCFGQAPGVMCPGGFFRLRPDGKFPLFFPRGVVLCALHGVAGRIHFPACRRCPACCRAGGSGNPGVLVHTIIAGSLRQRYFCPGSVSDRFRHDASCAVTSQRFRLRDSLLCDTSHSVFLVFIRETLCYSKKELYFDLNIYDGRG